MADIDFSTARRVKAEIVERLGANARFAGAGLTVHQSQAAVQVNRTSGPPLPIDRVIAGVVIVQQSVGEITPR
jgi:hypothetical protein